MKAMVNKMLILAVMLAAASDISAQKQLKSHRDYIGKYNELAVKHMGKYRIPASITLAQALLESGAGLSELARSSNNHFGIKCHSEWRGERIFRRDDKPNDCFRKYKTVADSYEDHSRFLSEKARYSVLFTYSMKDYGAWARGLQKCGYATDRSYASKLIKCIEDYRLYEYDVRQKSAKKKKEWTPKDESPRMRPTFITHGLVYVEAEAGDSFEHIAYDMGFKTKNLLKYNEVPKGFPLKKGDIVYLEKKKKRADDKYALYTVKIGDSMHGISQRYGIRLKDLYRLNGKARDYVPSEGDVLRLR
jgi:hypothetical protein